MKHKQIAVEVTKLLLCTLLAACSGGGGGSSADSGKVGGTTDGKVTAVDACTLLTEEEVVAAIGVTIEKIEKGSAASGVSFCHWYGNDPAVLQKGITVIASIDSSAKERWESHRALIDDAVAVFGIGTEAFTSMKAPTYVTLYKDRVYMMVSPLYNGAGLDWKQTKPLAEKALAKALLL